MILHAPRSEAEVVEIVRGALAGATPLALQGGGTRAGFGHAVAAEAGLSTSALSGILRYTPGEMVMTALAGTPLEEVEAALAGQGQRLAFEPADHRPAMGTQGVPTIGGVFAANVSGPRRIAGGAARDSLLGIRFVNGRGEALSAGGRVMKNVTGLDLVKLMAGSYGTLGLMTEVTFRVLPQPERVETLVFSGLEDQAAAELMAAAMALPADVSGAAHLPESVRGRFLAGALPEGAATLLRLEGHAASVAIRAETLTRALGARAPLQRLGPEQSESLWRAVRDIHPYAEDGTQRPLWRVSVAPMAGPGLVAALRMEAGVDAFYDWQGGLVWLRMEAEPEAALLRGLIAKAGGGHATLLRANPAARAAIPAFEPQPAPLAALAARVKASLDPHGLFNPGRMG
ncbi:2-hydroxy-acid oxidase [Rhizobium rhizosphaerae]|uniref:2-hydroxy-acid oxidase n=1 Tax=Xaviernesmea rhizosphaerae TaxID=1672749 RepID=A0A1Q9AP31_9HYPH|nr:glycolate oxidase subunit GlcE [Xaviernesmea rhizosphaerae]OLP57103.1 2-hydroxy-acid oxidase [Xaviernesmea rhizosphaerae]